MIRKILTKTVRLSIALAIGSFCIAWPLETPLFSDGIKTAQAASGQTAVISGSFVNLRSGPDTSYAVTGQVKQGDKLPVLGKQGDWLKVRTSSGQPAWVAGWLVKLENEPAGDAAALEQYAVITANHVNVRSGPGTGYQAVGMVNAGERYPLLATSGQWHKIKLSDQEVWLAGWLTKIEEAAATKQPAQNSAVAKEPVPAWLPKLTPEQNNAGEQGNQEGIGDSKADSEQNNGSLIGLDIEYIGDKTVVTVDADSEIDYNTFMLTNPRRLVINFNGFNLGQLPETTKNVNSASVTNIRTGQFSTDPPIARLVLDLKGRVSYRTETARNGKRLIVEVSEIKHSEYGEYVEDKVIFIDPGHGGSDPGASGSSRQVWEEEINLDIAKRLADILNKQGATVLMSRLADETVDLYARSAMANQANADIFISIHCDANLDPGVGGTTTYYYAPATRADLFEQQPDRLRLAQSIQTELINELNLENRGIRQANYAVLRETGMPSVLVETAFISNPNEEQLLRDANFRRRVAEAIARGINAYFAD